jgi:hypothetical protein
LPYIKTIRLIRHPVDSFYSYYLWGQAFHKTMPEYWMPRDKLKKSIKAWRRFQEYWNLADDVLTIRYEDLFNDPGPQLQLILEAIGYQVDPEDIARAIAKYPPQGSLFKHLDHFTKDDLSLVYDQLSDLMQLYGYGMRHLRP